MLTVNFQFSQLVQTMSICFVVFLTEILGWPDKSSTTVPTCKVGIGEENEERDHLASAFTTH